MSIDVSGRINALFSDNPRDLTPASAIHMIEGTGGCAVLVTRNLAAEPLPH